VGVCGGVDVGMCVGVIQMSQKFSSHLKTPSKSITIAISNPSAHLFSLQTPEQIRRSQIHDDVALSIFGDFEFARRR